VDSYRAFCREAVTRLARRSTRLRFVVAPVSPQWCSDELLTAAADFAREADVCFHTHVLETAVQAEGFRRRFGGESMIAHLARLGALSERATLAHVVWASDDDLDVLARHDVSVVHNPVSNLKLGSGIGPWRGWWKRRINVGLGTDGVGSNDSARLFDVMRFAALIHRSTSWEFGDWPTADEVLQAATRGGARCLLRDAEIGSLEPGKAADLVLLDLDALSFQPPNDLVGQLVHCENGSGVTLVMVGGEVVVADGRVTTVDEAAVIASFRQEAERELARRRAAEAPPTQLRRRVESVYRGIHGGPR
jgi:cytosine/adenosine deaminase-related metal-dependent hydrolase